MTEDQKTMILKRWPLLPNPGKRIPYGYKVKVDDPTRIEPDLDIIFALEEALDQIDNGISLRVATDFLTSRVPEGQGLSHMGLKKVRNRLRPGTARAPTKRKRIVRKDDAYRLEEKRKQKIANDKRTIAFAEKRIRQAQKELGILKENKENENKPLFDLPTNHEIFQNVELPEGIEQENLIFRPSARQAIFLAAPEYQVLYGGAAGGGKSYALLADAARYIPISAFNGVVIRRTLPELTELIWESHSLYPPLIQEMYGRNIKAKWSENAKTWTFPDGGHLQFSFCEAEKDVLNYQGKAYTWVGFDELTQHPTPVAWNYLMGRVRTKDERLRPLLSMRAATNPGGPGHGWVKKMFIDPAPYDTRFPAQDFDGNIMLVPEGDKEYPPERWGTPLFYRRFIPAKLSDNPFLGYEYRAALQALPEGLRAQLLDGDWNASEGAAFPEFRRSLHVIRPEELPDSWRRFRSCDFGYSQKSASAVHWYAVDPYDTIYVYRELYVKQMTARVLAQKILELEAGESISYGMLDSSCWHQKGHSGPSIAEEMISEGCRWRPSDRTAGARTAGKNRLHELLRVDSYTGKPGILFFENCRQIISDLEVIPVDPDGADDIDQKYAEDHAYDSLRYGVMSRPRSASLFDTFGRGVTRPAYRPADMTFGY